MWNTPQWQSKSSFLSLMKKTNKLLIQYYHPEAPQSAVSDLRHLGCAATCSAHLSLCSVGLSSLHTSSKSATLFRKCLQTETFRSFHRAETTREHFLWLCRAEPWILPIPWTLKRMYLSELVAFSVLTCFSVSAAAKHEATTTLCHHRDGIIQVAGIWALPDTVLGNQAKELNFLSWQTR